MSTDPSKVSDIAQSLLIEEAKSKSGHKSKKSTHNMDRFYLNLPLHFMTDQEVFYIVYFYFNI